MNKNTDTMPLYIPDNNPPVDNLVAALFAYPTETTVETTNTKDN